MFAAVLSVIAALMARKTTVSPPDKHEVRVDGKIRGHVTINAKGMWVYEGEKLIQHYGKYANLYYIR